MPTLAQIEQAVFWEQYICLSCGRPQERPYADNPCVLCGHDGSEVIDAKLVLASVNLLEEPAE